MTNVPAYSRGYPVSNFCLRKEWLDNQNTLFTPYLSLDTTVDPINKVFETLSSQIGSLEPELQNLEISDKSFNVRRSLFIPFLLLKVVFKWYLTKKEVLAKYEKYGTLSIYLKVAGYFMDLFNFYSNSFKF